MVKETSVLTSVTDEESGFYGEAEFVTFTEKNLSQIKLLLRPLSSMTEEEEREMIATQDDVKLEGYPEILLKADSGETFLYMLRKGFDLFGLIEKGEAVSMG